MVPGAPSEAKGLNVEFFILFEYVKRGLRLAKDSFTASITSSEILKYGLAGSVVRFCIVSISTRVRLSTASVNVSILG